MSHVSRCRMLLVLLAVLLCLAASPGCSGSASPAGATLGAPPTVPVQMTLPRLGGGAVSLETLRGRPVLITLFTTWSVICQEEAQSFERFHERFGPMGLAVLGIALNSEGVTPVQLVSLYVEEMGFRFPVLLSAPDDPVLSSGLGPTRSVPRTVLLDRQGKIVLDQLGRTRFQIVEAKLLELLKGRPPAR